MSSLPKSDVLGVVGNINFARRSVPTPRDRMNSPLGAYRDPKVSAAYGGTQTVTRASSLFDSDCRLKGISGYGRASTIHSNKMRIGSIAQHRIGQPLGAHDDPRAARLIPTGFEDRRRLGLASIPSLAARGGEMRECLSPSHRKQDTVPARTQKFSTMLSSQSDKELCPRAVRQCSPVPSSFAEGLAVGLPDQQVTICVADSDSSPSRNPREERSWLSSPLARQKCPQIRRQRSAIELRTVHEECDETFRESLVRSNRLLRRHSSAMVLPSERSGTYARSPSPRAVKDHMWRTLSDREELDPLVPRLRGEGCVIGKKGKASQGISWRQLPEFSPGGNLRSVNEPGPVSEDIRVAIGVLSNRETLFSGYKPTMVSLSTDCSERSRLTTPPRGGNGQTARVDKRNSSPLTKPSARSPRMRPLSPVSAFKPSHIVPTNSSCLDDQIFAEKAGKTRNRQDARDLRDGREFQPQRHALSPERLQTLETPLPSSKLQDTESTKSLSTVTTTTLSKVSTPRTFWLLSPRAERPKWR